MSKQNPRSVFPVGNDVELRFMSYQDNQNVAVDVWAISCGEKYFTANLICPYTAPKDARWLIGSIQCPDGEPVWGYRDDARVLDGFSGLIYPMDYENITYLIYQSKGGKPRVVHAVPLLDFLQKQEPQRPLTDVIKKKRLIAEKLEMEVEYSSAEQIVMKHQIKLMQQTDEAERERKRQQRLAERQRKVSAILARNEITVTANNRKVTAIWVIEDEWKILPPKTVVIAGKIGDDDKFYPEETFEVFKERGKEAQKRHCSPVGLRSGEKDLPKPIATKVVMVEGDPFEVPTFASRADLLQHQATGLNSGVLRGVIEEGKFSLFRVTKGKLVLQQEFEMLN